MILAIFADTVNTQGTPAQVDDALMAKFIEKVIASCDNQCQPASPEAREGLSECFKALQRSVRSYRTTTEHISEATRGELPIIDSIMSASSDTRVQEAAKSLRNIQEQLQKEIAQADESIREFQSQIETIRRNAHFDHITKMMNAYTFVSDILPILKVGERRHLDMGIIKVQIANYDHLLSEEGETVLNKVLIYITKILSGFVRKENKVYRYNYNTFYILLNRSSEEDIRNTKERIILQATKNTIEYNKKPIALELSVAYTAHEKGDTISGILERLEGSYGDQASV